MSSEALNDILHPPAANPYAGRDKVLLYVRGMDIPPVEGVELALESLRRAGDGAMPDAVMEELYGILREKGFSLRLAGPDGSPLVSAPPINRRSMTSEDLEQFSFGKTLALYAHRYWSALRQILRRGR